MRRAKVTGKALEIDLGWILTAEGSNSAPAVPRTRVLGIFLAKLRRQVKGICRGYGQRLAASSPDCKACSNCPSRCAAVVRREFRALCLAALDSTPRVSHRRGYKIFPAR